MVGRGGEAAAGGAAASLLTNWLRHIGLVGGFHRLAARPEMFSKRGIRVTSDQPFDQTEAPGAGERVAGASPAPAPAPDQIAFHLIADSIDQMIWSTRPDGFHDYFNKRWYDFTGVPAGSTDGEGWNGMFHPDDQERAWDSWRRSLATGQPYEIEYRLRHRSGVYRWVLGRAHPVRGAGGTILRWYGTCTDIHDRKVAEQKQRESEERLQRAFDAGAIGDYEWDLKTGAISWSENLMKIVGLPVDTKVDGETVWKLIHPEDREPTQAAVEQAIASRAPLDVAYRIVGTDGTTRWIASRGRVQCDADGSPARLVGVNFDITAVRQAQEEADRSSALLRAIGDATPDLIFAKDLDLRLLYANAATCRTIGIPPERVVGTSNRELATNEEEGAALDANDRMVIESGETRVLEEVFTSPDGTRRVFRTVKTPMRDAAGNVVGLVGVGTDLTDRVEAEELLRQSEARLRAIFDATPECIKIVAPDGTLMQMNEAGLCMIEAPGAEAVAGANVFELIAAPCRDEWRERHARIVAGESMNWEFDIIGLGGTRRRMETHAVPLPLPDGRNAQLAVTRDITRRKQTEDALRESEERFRTLADNMPTLCWWADASGYIYWYNRRWYEYTGTTPEDMEGWGWQSVHDPDVLPAVMERWTASIATGQPFEMTFPLRSAAGAFRPFLTRAVPLRDEAGEVVRWFGTNTDIAEVKQLEAALRDLNDTLEQRVAEEVEQRAQAEEALRQAQKMETLGQLTGGVAHDFNNLLQIVSGNIGLIQRGLAEGDAKLKRAADNAARGAERAAILTQRLLAFSRRQPLAPKATDPNRLVAGMSELLHRTLGETIEVETVLASGLWSVEVDPHQLENALLNLAINARDAMEGGGKLTIETANTHLDRAYASQNAGVAPGQYVAICVSDTGCGMDEDTVARAFEPFFTTKEVGKGTGLGLSMVYGFVKQSGGHLKIYSEPGEGTTVRIYLPRLHGVRHEPEEAASQAAPEGTREETILVCEDDDDVRAYTVEVLRELGYRVLEAHDGPSALRLLERQEGAVDLLFTDIVLPSGMTGAVLAHEAKALRPDLKVLFTTGYARNAIVHQGRLDPGVELITKPFSYSDLAARVRDILDGNG